MFTDYLYYRTLKQQGMIMVSLCFVLFILSYFLLMWPLKDELKTLDETQHKLSEQSILLQTQVQTELKKYQLTILIHFLSEFRLSTSRIDDFQLKSLIRNAHLTLLSLSQKPHLDSDRKEVHLMLKGKYESYLNFLTDLNELFPNVYVTTFRLSPNDSNELLLEMILLHH